MLVPKDDTSDKFDLTIILLVGVRQLKYKEIPVIDCHLSGSKRDSEKAAKSTRQQEEIRNEV